jgi:hypothetical protein
MIELLKKQEREASVLPDVGPLPGWFARRRRDVSPASERLSALPFGPVVPTRRSGHRPRATAPGAS